MSSSAIVGAPSTSRKVTVNLPSTSPASSALSTPSIVTYAKSSSEIEMVASLACGSIVMSALPSSTLSTLSSVSMTSSMFSRTLSFPTVIGSIVTVAAVSPARIVTDPVVEAKSVPSTASPDSVKEITVSTVLGRSIETTKFPDTLPSIALVPGVTETC